MSCIKTVSQAGLERVFGHEGVVPGIYNCPAHHATFGMGTLIHHGPSKILEAVKQSKPAKPVAAGKTPVTPDLSGHVRSYKQSKKSSAVEYLSVEIGEDKSYPGFVAALIAKHSGTARKLIEQESSHLEAGWDAYLADFRDGIQVYEQAICAAFPDVPLTQQQFDGFFSLTYNIGAKGLLGNKSLILAMKRFSTVTNGKSASEKSRQEAVSALLEQILRARPTAPGPVTGEVDKVSFKLTESGVFNGGLFNRRIAEASLIIGQQYSPNDTEIKIGRKTIKVEKDHQTTETARKQVRTVIDGLNAIERINSGRL
jgi:GH24 family phage-related lysozyme (muramidase)